MIRLLLGALLAGAAPVGPAPPPPPYAGVYQPRGTDEIGLWHDLDEEERTLAASPLVIRDEALAGYVKGVLCKAVGSDRCQAARIYILRVPLFNASMTANGTMRVYTGLLLRLRSEAELAAVLGHEFGHFERRHTLGRFRAGRTASDLSTWAAVLSAMSGSYAAMRTFREVDVALYGNLYRYSRDTEREADLLSLGYLNAGPLRPQSAAEVWQQIMAEAEASAAARGLRKPRFDAIAFAASHPPDAERAAYLRALAAPEGADRNDGAARYRAAMAPWLPRLLDDQIKLNDFGASDFIITALASGGWSAPLWLARGDLYRMRGHPRDLVAAAGFYASAIALDPRCAEAYRGAGIALLKTGHGDDGRAMLTRYLALRPGAADAAMIALLTTKDS